MATEKANFFCGLGLPKTGTTWLAGYLRDHPEVFVPVVKELQVFSRRFRSDLYDWLDDLMRTNLANLEDKVSKLPRKTDRHMELLTLQTNIVSMPHITNLDEMISAYGSIFRSRVTDDHLVFGEFSTTYCVLPGAGLQALDSVFPETRYIIVLRDPVERFWSHVKHQSKVKKNIDPLQCFSKKSEDAELLEICDYRVVIENIQRVIPSERLHFSLYEDLFVKHDQAALKEITDFLGLSFIPADLSKVVYAGESLAMPEDLKTEARLRLKDSYLFGAGLFGAMPEGWVSIER